jgi:hypothetical protein
VLFAEVQEIGEDDFQGALLEQNPNLPPLGQCFHPVRRLDEGHQAGNFARRDWGQRNQLIGTQRSKRGHNFIGLRVKSPQAHQGTSSICHAGGRMDAPFPLDEKWKYPSMLKMAAISKGEPPSEVIPAHELDGPKWYNAPTRELLDLVCPDGPGEEQRSALESLLHCIAVQFKPSGA